MHLWTAWTICILVNRTSSQSRWWPGVKKATGPFLHLSCCKYEKMSSCKFLIRFKLNFKLLTFLASFVLQNFLNSSSCPEIQGYLYVKETGRKSWKKLYVFLRRSGLYYSTKGMSKVPQFFPEYLVLWYTSNKPPVPLVPSEYINI